MALIDIFAIGMVLLSGLIALSTGFVRLVLGLLGWVGAAFSVLYGFKYVQPIAHEFISSELVADLTAGIGTFVTSLIILTIISNLIGKKVRNSSLSALDRSFGVISGLSIGIFITSASYFALVWAIDLPKNHDQHPQWIKSSKLFPAITWGAARIRNYLPVELKNLLPEPNLPPKLPRNDFESLVSPETQNSKKKSKTGYSNAERSEMNRLIKGQR
ncbi:MAG: hypothetical protein CMM44_00110 [Rhodospirillaceae bacterium]|nr:hypothetical protein [Rhodospirillaceae bacterium]|tara:strand:+ start:285 stop:932 length:648 start_codon:yes stop_codon:yes gene_type:complete